MHQLARSRLTPRRRVTALAALAALSVGVMHLVLDGLTSVLVPLQPFVALRTGAGAATLGLLVALALSSASLLQPLTAVLAVRWGEARTAAAGALLAAIGYGVLPAAGSVGVAAGAVVVGGLGAALFHPGAGAIVARLVQPGREALPLAAFSAAGAAGSALVPISVLSSIDGLGSTAAVPFAVTLAALTAGLLATRARRAVPSSSRIDGAGGAVQAPRATRSVVVPVAIAAMISLLGVSVTASAPLLLAESLGPTDPLLGYAVGAYGASAAVGGIGLALLVRRIQLRTVLLVAVAIGTLAALSLPHAATAWTPVVMLAAGAGLSGSLPLLVTAARKPGETSTAAAIGRVLGFATGLGGVGYAGVGPVQEMVGYGPALTIVAAVTGAAALGLTVVLRGRGTDQDAALHTALAACGKGGCACGVQAGAA